MERKHEYASYYQLIRAVATKTVIGQARLHGREIGPEEIDERIANAMAWAWVLFQRYRNSHDARKAAVMSGKWGAMRKQTLGHNRQPGYVDALDRSAVRDNLDTPETPQSGKQYYDGEDVIALLPARLRPTARLLASGLNRSAVAERLGVSNTTISTRVNQMRDILDALGAVA